MHFLIFLVAALVIWYSPTLRAIVLIGGGALLVYGLDGGIIWWIVWAVASAVIILRVRDELRARRRWEADSDVIREAEVRGARRDLG